MTAAWRPLLLLGALVTPTRPFSSVAVGSRAGGGRAIAAAPSTLGRIRRAASPQAAVSSRSRREYLLRELEAPVEPRAPDGAAEDDPAAPLALAACRAADARKALSVSALRVNHLTSATSFFVSMVGRSKAQINAIVKNVEDELRDEFGRTGHRQGKAMGGWVCLDYDDVVVNVFSEAQRDFYGIEKYWAAAQPLDLSDVLTPSAPEAAVDESDMDGDDVDDWELGDDWDLGDWSLDDAGTAADDVDVVAFDFSPDRQAADEGEEGEDMFSEFASGAGGLDDDADDSPFEIVFATPEEEEAAAAAVAERMARIGADGDDDDDDDGADWALGDERLRNLVERAEQQPPPSADAPRSWRDMMEEDGWGTDGELEVAAGLEDEEDDLDLD